MELVYKEYKQKSFQKTPLLFKQACEQLALITSAHGFHLAPYNESGLAHFTSLDIEQQFLIADAVIQYVSRLQMAQEQSVDLVDDNRKHAWWTLKDHGLVPPENLFGKLGPTDFIEIYDKDSIQIFRSFSLFKHLSYSLCEVFSYTWMELFERDDFTFRRISETINQILSGNSDDIVPSSLPSHIVKEKFSSGQQWIEMQHSFFSPLYTADGSIGGFLSAFRAINYGKNI